MTEAIQMTEEELEAKAHKLLRNKKRRRIAIAVVLALIVLVIGAFCFLAFKGVIAPGDVAAKYDTLSYITEDEVTEYIETYREQMGYSESDDGWAEFLYAYGMTPELLRQSTIRQLIIDAKIEKLAAKYGLSADEDEVDEYIQNMKETWAFDSDTIWEETLELYGTTEEALRETYRHSLLENAVCQLEVPVPSVSDEEILDYLVAYYAEDGLKAKHIYYLTIEVGEDDSELEVLAQVQALREMMNSEDEMTAEVWGAYVSMYCTDDDVVNRSGAQGWSIDMDDMSDAFQTTVENLKKGEISTAINEDGAYSLIRIDDVVKLKDLGEIDTEETDATEYLSVMPSTLYSYFSDCTAQLIWSSDCQDYLSELYDNCGVVINAVSGAPSYYVDMTELYAADAEDSEEAEDESDESDDSEEEAEE